MWNIIFHESFEQLIVDISLSPRLTTLKRYEIEILVILVRIWAFLKVIRAYYGGTSHNVCIKLINILLFGISWRVLKCCTRRHVNITTFRTLTIKIIHLFFSILLIRNTGIIDWLMPWVLNLMRLDCLWEICRVTHTCFNSTIYKIFRWNKKLLINGYYNENKFHMSFLFTSVMYFIN